MRRINYKKNLSMSIILLLILVIGVGYAYLTSNLSISGTTEIAGNSWDIHFENLNVKDGSVTATTPATISNSTTDITYSIKLERPKDYYEFTVDVKNDGTLPGKVSISSLAGITTEAAPIVSYTITYTNGRSVNIGDILNAGAKKTIRVRVFYKDDISATDFPANNLNLTLTYTLQYIQSEDSEFDTNALIEQLKEENSSCFTKYTGQVTDQPGQTVTASNVYFNQCADKRNIIFNNMCWQMIRTTETGGIKIIYNGDVVDDKCESTRGNHKGIVQQNYTDQTLSSNYLYGSLFTYDTSTNSFTLTDTETAIWGDLTYENLIGKFTCKSSSDTCTTIYQINGYKSNTQGYSSAYTISNTNYAQIGSSSYNANYRSPAMVGYMFNKVYIYTMNYPTGGSLMGNDVSYSNGIYTLLPADGESTLGTTKDATHHYTCNTTSSTCNKVRYYYYNNVYIELDGEENIDEAVNNMLYNDNVNRYNSSVKGIIDAWYSQYLSNKTNILEDTVYCNGRNIADYGSWNKEGSMNSYMEFSTNNLNKNLSCPSETDQFAVGNNKAKLIYPVSLISNEEWNNIITEPLRQTGADYWNLSTYVFTDINAIMYYEDTVGSLGHGRIYNSYGARPAVSIGSGAVISSGDGSETLPWIIQE